MSQPPEGKKVPAKLTKPMPPKEAEKRQQALLLDEARKAIDAAVEEQKMLYEKMPEIPIPSQPPSREMQMSPLNDPCEDLDDPASRHGPWSDEQIQDQGIPVINRALNAVYKLRQQGARGADDVLVKFLMLLYMSMSITTEEDGDDLGSSMNTMFGARQTQVCERHIYTAEAGSHEHNTFRKAVAAAHHFLLTMNIRDILHGNGKDKELTADEERSIEKLKEKRKNFAIFFEGEVDRDSKEDVARREKEWEEAVRKLR